MTVHPIVQHMSLSEEQWPAVTARGRDVAVTAGAGTGKTRTLVARYLSLLADGLPLRSIVAITFTEKAAREMRNRVREEMRHYLDRPGLAAEERDQWQVLYSALDAARIGTIHSLCAEILRTHPAEAGVDPRFEMLQEGWIHILQTQAIDETLGWAADDPHVVALFSLLGERLLRSILARLLQERLEAREVLVHLSPDLLDLWRRALTQRQSQILAGLLHKQEWLHAVRVLRRNAAGRAEDKLEGQRQEALVAVDGAVGPLEKQLASLACLAGIQLNVGSAQAWPGGAVQVGEVKAALGTLRDLWKGQAAVLELALTPLDDSLAQAMPLLDRCFRFACARYEALKRERHALDFDDLEHGALVLLERDAAARAYWQAEVQAILVDEFQDTNGRQRDLVAFLNGDGGKLFVVGDAKQSIYRFRGADVAVFRAERQQIAHRGGVSLPLATSYRAHEGLIQGLNDLLKVVMPDQEDPVRPWIEPFAPLGHYRKASSLGFLPPFIELHLAVGTKGQGGLDRAADALVARTLELVEGGSSAEDGSCPSYEDVAILCRASTSFGAYEDALERAGIPFLTVAGRGFYSRPEVRDLLNALRALADPTDDLALAGLLRSPALGISDGALYLLCRRREQGDRPLSLWEALNRPDAGLPQEDARWGERAIRIISELHQQVGRISVADLLKAFLDATDYRAALIQAGQSRSARNVSKLLSDAYASGIVSVGEFLGYVKGLRDSGTREGEARATAEGAVQIMSVHAAKGLEFPIVAIGDVTYSGRRSSSVLVDSELGVLLPLKDGEQEAAVYRLASLWDHDRDAAELDRLLYVAATRAREKLILSGCVSLKQDGKLGRLGGWLDRIGGPGALGLADASPGCDLEGTRSICVHKLLGVSSVMCAFYEPCWVPDHLAGTKPARGADRLPEEQAQLALPPPLLGPVPAGTERIDRRLAEQEPAPQRVWRVVPAVQEPGTPARVIGSLVHEALAGWRFPEGEAPVRTDDDFARWVQARARGYGIADPRLLADAVRRTVSLLRRFRVHPLYREVDRAERRWHEVPYSLRSDGGMESGVIDLLYLREGCWTLVEFKTDHVKDDTGLSELLAKEDYVPQARRYVAAAERLLGRRPRAILCMLNCADGVRLCQVEAGC